jgi:flagellar L-ring protein FlgH
MSDRLVRISAIGVASLVSLLASWTAAQAQATQTPLLYRSLYADRKAHRSGDILTVLITEAAAATATARTRTDKEESVFGNIQQPDETPWNIDLQFCNDFTGGGEILRTGKLLAKLAVIGDKVDENGNLLIRGEQDINVNNEQQRITLTGVVRPEDVAPDNTVMSWRISAAQIDFKGKGILARKQSPGLLTKLFDLFGLN